MFSISSGDLYKGIFKNSEDESNAIEIVLD